MNSIEHRLGQATSAAWPSLLVIGLLAGAPSVPAQTPNAAQALEQATQLKQQIDAATGSNPKPDAKTPSADPCAIVPPAEVKKVFPNAAAAPERSRRLEAYGITECTWKSPQGALLLGVQESLADASTQARDEARDMALGIADPLKPAARNRVRIETFSSLKFDNAAFVETANPASGILSDAAFLALASGPRLITLAAPDLARRGRHEALKALESLAAAAQKSMTK